MNKTIPNFIQNIEVVRMPIVKIVKPNTTKEERDQHLKNVSSIMEQIVFEEYGASVKIKLFYKNEFEEVS
jgi:hypothetical protein